MGSIDDIMQLCRLCLVKDQVNIPIFDETSDIRQTFLKINQCLPVKVSRDDNLPKKICDGCSYKLDMLYVFRNTSVDSEKQLISWLNQAGLGSCSLPQTIVKDGVTKPEIMVKQETFETAETRLESENPELNQELGVDTHSYIIQQQKLPYQQDFAAFGESSASTNLVSEEPPPKKAKRAAATKKQVPLETDEDALETAMQITKAEEEDSDDVDQPDYVEAPSTSAEDQPGPSGVGKGTIEAPAIQNQVITFIPRPHRPIFLLLIKEEPRDANSGNKKEITSTFAIVKDDSRKVQEETNVNKRAYRCKRCNIPFGKDSLLRKHRKLFHKRECLYCNDTFEDKYEVEAHSVVHTVNGLYPCISCDRRFETYILLISHQKDHENAKRYCAECDENYENLTYLQFQKHIKRHNWDVMVTCNFCNKPMKKKALKYHQMAKHNVNVKAGSVVCHYCNEKFGNTWYLKVHIRRTHEKMMYLCEMCGKFCTTLSSLRHHLHIHKGEKPFACDRCGKRFVNGSSLKIHLLVHTREKPHVCKICNKRYSQRSTLSTHMKVVHIKDTRYSCPVCNKRFAVKSLLNTHVKGHEKVCVKEKK